MQPDDPGVQLSPDEVAFFKRYYADYTVGRRLACFLVRALIAIGAVCGALAAIMTLAAGSISLWQRWHS